MEVVIRSSLVYILSYLIGLDHSIGGFSSQCRIVWENLLPVGWIASGFSGYHFRFFGVMDFLVSKLISWGLGITSGLCGSLPVFRDVTSGFSGWWIFLSFRVDFVGFGGHFRFFGMLLPVLSGVIDFRLGVYFEGFGGHFRFFGMALPVFASVHFRVWSIFPGFGA